MSVDVVARAYSAPPSIGLQSGVLREANAMFAIAWREVLRAVKSPLSLMFTVIFPVIFIGLLGGSIADNLTGALPYSYLPFMLIGMIANTLYQGTVAGVMNLVEERESDFTAELFVAPISRFTVLIGKIIGSGAASLISLVGVLGMVVVMRIPLDPVAGVAQVGEVVVHAVEQHRVGDLAAPRRLEQHAERATRHLRHG